MLFMVTYAFRPEHRDVVQARFKQKIGRAHV